jgi:pyridoxal phosphate-dependent aminotransferase EpsN
MKVQDYSGQKNGRIYLSAPDLDGAEQEYLLNALNSNWIAPLGPEVDAFERDMCDHLGARSAVALSSGTAALHLALVTLGVQPGDVVLCSDFTFVASANPIAYCGAEPVFIDSEAASWNMDPGLLEEALETYAKKNRLPKAVIVVDLYGQAADFTRIREACERYQVPIIEDAAEAVGSTYMGKACGTFGAMGILSFNGNKIITTSGGGMLITDNPAYVERARHLATQAADSYPFYHHTSIGYNYRLSNLLAALGRAQLKNLEHKVLRRRNIFSTYQQELSGLPGITFMPEIPHGRSNRWLSTILIDPSECGTSNEALRLYLESREIESRPLWKPMHLQPVYKECASFGGSVSERLFDQGLSLPSGTGMSDRDLDRVVTDIKECNNLHRE